MAPSELKFYKAPKDENGNPLWVPIVIKNRDQVESLIYQVFDTVDPSHTNSDYYRNIFNRNKED